MKVLFAFNSEQSVNQLVDFYKKTYGEKLEVTKVYFFRALIDTLKKNKNFDRIVIHEELEPFGSKNQDAIDKYLFNNLDKASDEAGRADIIVICTERRQQNDKFVKTLFNLGIYNILTGQDRTFGKVSELINKPRTKKEAKMFIDVDLEENPYEAGDKIDELELRNIIKYYEKNIFSKEKIVSGFDSLYEQYTFEKLKQIVPFLPIKAREVLEQESQKYIALMTYKPPKGGKGGKEKVRVVEVPVYIQQEEKKKDEKQEHLFQPVVEDAPNPIVEEEPSVLDNIVNPIVAPIAAVVENIVNKPEEEKSEEKVEIPPMVEPKIEKPEVKVEMPQVVEPKIEKPEVKIEIPPVVEPKIEKTEVKVEMPPVVEPTMEKEEPKIEAPVMESQVSKVTPKVVEPVTEIDKKPVVQKFDENFVSKTKTINIAEDTSKNDDIKVQKFEELYNIQSPELENKPPVVEPKIEKPEIKVEVPPVVEPKIEKPEIKVEVPPVVEPKIEKPEVKVEVPPVVEPKIEKPEIKVEVPPVVEPKIEKPEIKAEMPPVAEPKIEKPQPKVEVPPVVEPKIEKPQPKVEVPPVVEPKIEKPEVKVEVPPVVEPKIIKPQPKVEVPPVVEPEIIKPEIVKPSYTPPVPPPKYQPPKPIPEEPKIQTVTQVITKEVFTEVYDTPRDYKKAVCFVGAHKTGTTFVINALASVLAGKGVKVAILDLTTSKDSYLIYANKDADQKDIAANSLSNLAIGQDKPLRLGNLSVYTSIPRTMKSKLDVYKAIEIAKREHSVVLIDCDFSTKKDFPDVFRYAQSIYVVHDMDTLNILPITMFLKELKSADVDNTKISVIINKYMKASMKIDDIIGSLSFYTSPDFSVMEEGLLPKNVNKFIIPFDEQNYLRYIENLSSCKMNFSGFSDEFKQAISIILQDVFPIGSKPVSRQQNEGGFMRNIFGRK